MRTIRTHDKGVIVRLDDRRAPFVNQARVANEAEHEKISVFSERLKSFWRKENERTIHA